MLPSTYDHPVAFAEGSRIAPITIYVLLELLLPKARVPPGPVPMGRATVPKAAVDENSHPLAGKNDIGLATDLRARSNVFSEAQPHSMQQRPDGNLGTGVP